jgi:GNAT superfamily N-acetyltransferase
MKREDDRCLCWRQTEFTDLPAIDRIGDEIHVDLREHPEVFEEKFHLFPQGCLVLSEADAIVGYGFFHPWRLYSIPPLDTLLVRLPDSPDCMFIHDVVVLPAARGRGAARAFLRRALEIGGNHRIATLALVSVYNSYVLWARDDFEIVTDTRVEEKLKSYGPSARYMIRMPRAGDPPLPGR